MQAISKLNGHYLVCGAGHTGYHIVEELYKTRRQFIVIDQDSDVLAKLEKTFPKILTIVGDATRDDVLYAAGIERAVGMVAALDSDRDNVFMIVSAHRIHPELRIVAKNVAPENKDNLIAAGAISVVSPGMVGGVRLSSELMRPNVVTFMDEMLRDRRNVRVEEIRIPDNSWVIGKRLEELQLTKRLGVQIIALRDSAQSEIDYSPSGEYECKAGSVLIITATPDKVAGLAQFVAEKRESNRI